MFNPFRHTPVAIKVALAPTFALLCLVLVGAIGLMANHRLSTSLIQLGGSQVPRILAVADLDQRLGQVHARVNQSLAWEGAGFKAEKIAALDKMILRELGEYSEAVKKAAADPNLTALESQLLDNVASEFAQYRKHATDALDIKTGMPANAASFMTTMEGNYVNLKNALDSLNVSGKGAADEAVTAARELAHANQVAILGAFGVAFLATLLISTLMSRLIVRPLTAASRVAHAVADGDLSTEPTANCSRDATGQVLAALGAVSHNLSQIVTGIRATAEQINQASLEIATGNADLSGRTDSTAAALQQTAASIEELSTTIRLSADSAQQADSLARDASAVAREGGQVVNDVITTMDAINAQARKIGEIVGVIDSIAFQTNILALNAAVEAARAGEQGRGFGVVASEVRSLAQRSADAAKEIRGLISSSVERIDAGVAKVRVAGETMGRIVTGIERVSSTVEEIASAAAQQAAGINQVSQAVSTMDRSTQQNAAMVQQAGSATESLNKQAQSLVEMLGRFRTA